MKYNFGHETSHNALKLIAPCSNSSSKDQVQRPNSMNQIYQIEKKLKITIKKLEEGAFINEKYVDLLQTKFVDSLL